MTINLVHAQSIKYEDILSKSFNSNKEYSAISDFYSFAIFDSNFVQLQNHVLLDSTYIVDRFYMRFSPDGNKITFQFNATTLMNQVNPHFLQIWNLLTGQKEYDIYDVLANVPLTWNPDNTQFAVAHINNSSTVSTRIYDAGSGLVVLELPYEPISLIWGDYLVINQGSEGLVVFDVQSNFVVQTINIVIGIEQPIAISPSGESLSFPEFSARGNIIILDLSTGQISRPFPMSSIVIRHLVWTTDGIIGSSSLGESQLWNANSGKIEALDVFQGSNIYVDKNLDLVLVDNSQIGLYLADRENNILSLYQNDALPHTNMPIFIPTSTEIATTMPTSTDTRRKTAASTPTLTTMPTPTPTPAVVCNITVASGNNAALIAAIQSGNSAGSPYVLQLIDSVVQ